jgi:hypothetical protein
MIVTKSAGGIPRMSTVSAVCMLQEIR